MLSDVYEESERLRALKATKLLDSEAELRFDRITRMAKNALGTEIALVSLIDKDRQWFKSNMGLDVTETARDIAFCDHAIRTPQAVTVVLDAAKDKRFDKNPLVTGEPNISFYAGAPLVTPDGHALGTLCVIDSEARSDFSDNDRQLLLDLAETVMAEINTSSLQQTNTELMAKNDTLGEENTDLANMNADLSLINEELQHRMGNMYAHISGLVSMLGRADTSREQLVRRIRSKITVLAQTQTLLAKNDYSRVSLTKLAHKTLEPFGFRRGLSEDRVIIQSENDVFVSPRAAFTLTLMLNELATNAMKHGALANDAGQVKFSWTMTPSPKLSWRETFSSQAHIVKFGKEKGFGMQILDRIVPLDFQGDAHFDIHSNGLNYDVTAVPDRILG